MATDVGTIGEARIDIGPPRLLTAGAVAVMVIYGLVWLVPVLVGIALVSVVPFGASTFLIVLIIFLGCVLFMPIGLGNPHMARLVRSLHPAAGPDPQAFIVQLTLFPRIRSGLRALIEDADDVGLLSFTHSGLLFHGDSVRLSLPFAQVAEVQRRTIGWRGLFLYGPRVALAVRGLPGVEFIEFTERSSRLLPASRRTAQALYHHCCGPS